MATQKFSRAAYERLKAEFDDLTTRGRIEVAEKIERAREEGDLSENAGYHAAKDEQGHMEGRIRQLEHMLEDAEIVDVTSSCTPSSTTATRPRWPSATSSATSRSRSTGADVISHSSPLGSVLQGRNRGPGGHVSGAQRSAQSDRAQGRADLTTGRHVTAEPASLGRRRAAGRATPVSHRGRNSSCRASDHCSSATRPAPTARRRSCCCTVGPPRPTSTSSHCYRPLSERWRCGGVRPPWPRARAADASHVPSRGLRR